MSLANEIIKYRAINELTQKQFAALCKVSPPTISNIEKGNGRPTKLTQAKISLFLCMNNKEEENYD